MTRLAKERWTWQWVCDFCDTGYGAITDREDQLDPIGVLIGDGWSIGKVHGDACPACLAKGVQPKSERHSLHGGVEKRWHATAASGCSLGYYATREEAEAAVRKHARG